MPVNKDEEQMEPIALTDEEETLSESSDNTSVGSETLDAITNAT